MVLELILTDLFVAKVNLLQKYREVAMHPEVEQAVEDICNEAIVYGSEKYPVGLNLDFSSVSDEVKDKNQ